MQPLAAAGAIPMLNMSMLGDTSWMPFNMTLFGNASWITPNITEFINVGACRAAGIGMHPFAFKQRHLVGATLQG